MIYGEFEDGSGYVFNNIVPDGVKYLSSDYYHEFINHIQRREVDGKIGAQLRDHGLLTESCKSTPNKSYPRQRAFTVWFHVSNECNLSCAYCYIPNLKKASNQSVNYQQIINIDTAKQAISELFKYCESAGFDTLQLKFAGGEPLLAVNILECACYYASQLSEITGINISYRILTNGVLITDRVIELLKKYKFGVSISLDGGKYAHDKLRFVVDKGQRHPENGRVYKQGTWDTISQNIEQMISSGIKPYILCTVTLENHDTLLEVANFCASRSIGFRYSLVRDKKTSTNLVAQQKILESLVNVYKYLGIYLPVTMPLERFARFSEWDMKKRKLKVCGVCNSTLCVDNQGQVSTCQMNMSTKYGAVADESLSIIVNRIAHSGANALLVNPEKKQGGCQMCEWRFVCAGGCPEHTRMVYGIIDHISPWCFVYKGLLPIYVEAIAKQIKRALVTV